MQLIYMQSGRTAKRMSGPIRCLFQCLSQFVVTSLLNGAIISL